MAGLVKLRRSSWRGCVVLSRLSWRDSDVAAKGETDPSRPFIPAPSSLPNARESCAVDDHDHCSSKLQVLGGRRLNVDSAADLSPCLFADRTPKKPKPLLGKHSKGQYRALQR